MTEFAFLSGKVLKQSLPAFEPPIAASAPTVKRLMLPQGELAQFHDADEPIRYIAYLVLREGTVRGNHYHEVKNEWVYLIAGEIDLIIEDVKTKARESVPMRAGDKVFIPTGVAHAFRTIKSGQAVEFSPARFSMNDTHRYPLV